MGAPLDPLYVCVHVPEFAAQALLRLRPDLAALPVVVVDGNPPLDQVCSANTHALRLGVTQGMSRAEMDSFTVLHILRRAEAQERAARAAMLDTAAAFTPRIQIGPPAVAGFTLVLDMTGSELIFGSPAHFIGRIQQAFQRLNLAVRVVGSANFHTALCIAPTARKAPILVPPGREAALLAPLPLSALNLTEAQAETLSLWGLHTIGDLAVLPEEELIVRLGQPGKRLRLLARGQCAHLMVPVEPDFTLQEFLAFDAPVELMESLLFVLGPMLDQLLARALNRSLALASVTLTLALEGGGEHRRTVKPALPVMEREVLLKLLQLELQTHPPAAGVLNILARAEPGDRSRVQLGLFAPQLPEPTRLEVTLARIAALVGEQRVGRITLLDSHQPNAFTVERFVLPPASPVKKEQPVRHTVALRRCRPPFTLDIEHREHRPAAFFFQGKRFLIQQAYGPWRKSGVWWSSGVWSTEEWDISATATQSDEKLLCLVSHDLLHHHWRLEALYD